MTNNLIRSQYEQTIHDFDKKYIEYGMFETLCGVEVYLKIKARRVSALEEINKQMDETLKRYGGGN